MKVLIIGENSFIAKYFIRTCGENEINYVTCSHLDIPKKFDDFTWVVNFTINPKFFTDEYSEAIDQDVLIAKQVSKYQNLKYVMISSRMVCSSNNLLIPMLEDCKVKQKYNSIYGFNKILSEKCCRSIIKFDNLLIIRGSNIFGYEYGRKSFTGVALNRLICKSEILLDISKKTIRDFIPVNYFSDCLMQLMLKKCNGVYNIGSGLGTSLEDFCNAMIKGYGGGSITTLGDTVIKDQFILDNKKLLSVVSCNINKNKILQYAISIGKKLKIEEIRRNNV
jgi:dTDP-4-dehydrorhamnose reductase